MNPWEETFGAERGAQLAEILSHAARISHRENGLRHSAEDLGDDALIYGLCTTINARHLAATMIEATEGLEDVVVRERGRVWWLELHRDDQHAVRVYFYKAPPGATRVEQLNLKDSEIKKELSVANGAQLTLFSNSGRPGSPKLLNLVVVHYGDQFDGLVKVDVGAPYLIEADVAWEWDVCLHREEATDLDRPILRDDQEGYPDLRLADRPEADTDPTTEDGAAEDFPAEPATSEFDALDLREDDQADSGESSS